MILIDERLPKEPLHSEVVLHVRRHLRRSLRAGRGTAGDLALLFGLSSDEEKRLKLRRALDSASKIEAAAELIANARTAKPSVISLGHDDEHLDRCRAWLRLRKAEERAFDGIVATDLEMLLELSKARDYATGNTPEVPAGLAIPILIEGETGTGKELVARAIHDIWVREQENKGGFHVVQVSGLPPDLINDELFGHVRGAYTGAQSERPGRLEEADHGTLLIDEIGDLPLAAQVRLLRFLQDQKLSRVGENRERQIQVRILAATWHTLDEDIARGAFRRDLLHRIRVGWLRLPPLRKRRGVFTDVIPELLHKLGQKALPPITRSATEALSLHQWPGNLRELVGVLRLALSSAGGSTVRLEDLPPHLQRPYLEQPLFKRAPGFLCDEADGQGLTAELASWRVKEVARSLDALEAPEAAADIAGLHNFFATIPDASEDHKTVVQHLQHHQELTREQGRLTAIETEWRQIRSAPQLPDEVVRALVEAQQKALTKREAVDLELIELSRSTHLIESPWFKLLSEIREIPVFAQQDLMRILQGFIPMVTLAVSVFPDLIEKVRSFSSKGSILEQMRKALGQTQPSFDEADSATELQEEGTTNESADQDALPTKPRDYSREHWEVVLSHFRSKSSAARFLKMDQKTITSHLRRLDIEERWTGNN
ncbi:sigma-54-dependent Fis family transcriptional regulator [Chondromyces crocatus]|uniref:Sigma-54 factor interaction domain-containing protein n=1 Tax=Chondromyces crocatus TaxID=52 RepID=A0A0K1EB33_CHOCO|nr:sigma 54-interacting transcriptional regulator [Chondromyces crocatus]AKT37793.1 uncharacterized protein CMC5_019350 [Chondromyces crocatus]